MHFLEIGYMPKRVVCALNCESQLLFKISAAGNEVDENLDEQKIYFTFLNIK